MKLFVYDHCPFCVKARMIFGLTQTPVECIYLDNDDEATPIAMVGKKMLPILEKTDGSFMPESMDIVHYIDSLQSTSVFQMPPSVFVSTWVQETQGIIQRLVMPRTALYPFAEFPTQSSQDYYIHKKEDYLGPFAALIDNTPEYLTQIHAQLQKLNDWMATEHSVQAALSEDDIHVFAWLRNLSLVKGVQYPEKVKHYMQFFAEKTNIPLLWDTAI